MSLLLLLRGRHLAGHGVLTPAVQVRPALTATSPVGPVLTQVRPSVPVLVVPR